MDELVSTGESWLSWLEQHPQLYTLAAIALLLLLAFVSNWITKHVLLAGLTRALRHTRVGKDHLFEESRVITRLSNVVPALVLSAGVSLIPNLPEFVTTVVRNVASAFIILTVALAIANFLTILNRLYERRPDAAMKPIKGYVQVVKIGIYVVAALLIVATLIDRSPVILLSGLGAMAAVLMLVFQDTLLSLVASMQITSNDIIRVGDWVEMPGLNADGDVIDISLHVVKVQNWDKTITTIPTRRFIDTAFKNWRGMQQAGGRRMMREIMIDQQSIRFLSQEELEHLQRFTLLKDYIKEKDDELEKWNEELENNGVDTINTRRLTNLGTFRAYISRYLKNHPGIHQELFMLVRQLAPTADGVPLQVYAFSNDTAWAAYEGIQSDIFDHLFAIIPEFGLRVYQHPSGFDMRGMLQELVKSTSESQGRDAEANENTEADEKEQNEDSTDEERKSLEELDQERATSSVDNAEESR